jgi:hypothetical protein
MFVKYSKRGDHFEVLTEIWGHRQHDHAHGLQQLGFYLEENISWPKFGTWF